jgi:hypothetical protein
MEGATLGNAPEHRGAVPHRRPADSLHGRCHNLCHYAAASLPVIGVAKVYWPSSEYVPFSLDGSGRAMSVLVFLLTRLESSPCSGVALAHRYTAALHYWLGRRCYPRCAFPNSV